MGKSLWEAESVQKDAGKEQWEVENNLWKEVGREVGKKYVGSGKES